VAPVRWAETLIGHLMRSETNRALVLRYVAAFNQGDIPAVCECFAPDALIYGVLGWGGLDKAQPIWEQLVGSFQFNLQVDAMVSDDSIVAVRYTERGKFVAPFRGIQPTQKSYEMVAMEWFEISERGIAKRWGARDSASMFKQMGIALP
jgi:predicted ester cyclase